MKTNEASLPDTAQILRLDQTRRRSRRTDSGRRRFKLLPYRNRSTGTQSWRVAGTTRTGVRIRENYASKDAAQCRCIALEAEFMGRAPEDPALRATRLTEAQLRICEAVLPKLDTDDDLMFAIDQWLRSGKHRLAVESPRLDEAVAQFVQWVNTTPQLRDLTKRNLCGRVGVFASNVLNVRVGDIDPDFLERYLSLRKVSPATKDAEMRVLSRFFSWCIERPRRWLTTNPAKEVRIEFGETKPPTVLSLAECESLLRAAEGFKGGKLVPYVSICLFAGMRPSEVVRLRPDQINLADEEIHLEAPQSKTGRSRTITINPTLRKWLRAYGALAVNPPTLQKEMRVIKRQAGFGTPTSKEPNLKPWVEDVLRHTAISHYFRQTGSYGKAAEQFGNSEAIIKTHYQGRVTSEETRRFYALAPKNGSK